MYGKFGVSAAAFMFGCIGKVQDFNHNVKDFFFYSDCLFKILIT